MSPDWIFQYPQKTAKIVESLIEVSEELRDEKFLIKLLLEYYSSDDDDVESLVNIYVHSVKRRLTGNSDLIRSQSRKGDYDS